jgi:hypothetical protein
MANTRYPCMRPLPTLAPEPSATLQHASPQLPQPPPVTTPATIIAPPCASRQPCPGPHISSANDMHLLEEYNKKNLGCVDYNPSAASLGKSFYERYLSLSLPSAMTSAPMTHCLARHLRHVNCSEGPLGTQATTIPSTNRHVLRQPTSLSSSQGSWSPRTSWP